MPSPGDGRGGLERDTARALLQVQTLWLCHS